MFDLTHQPIDCAALAAALQDDRAGALASFEGRARNHNEGRAVSRLQYEAYESLARTEGERILAEARQRFDIIDACCVHRIGALGIGDTAIWVGALAAHRRAALDACQYILEQVKARVPIWKKEHYSNGESGWVNCPQCEPSVGRVTGEVGA